MDDRVLVHELDRLQKRPKNVPHVALAERLALPLLVGIELQVLGDPLLDAVEELAAGQKLGDEKQRGDPGVGLGADKVLVQVDDPVVVAEHFEDGDLGDLVLDRLDEPP